MVDACYLNYQQLQSMAYAVTYPVRLTTDSQLNQFDFLTNRLALLGLEQQCYLYGIHLGLLR